MGSLQRLTLLGWVATMCWIVAAAHAAPASLDLSLDLSISPANQTLLAAANDPSVDAAIQEQQRQIQLEQERLARERQARDQARQAPPIRLPEAQSQEAAPKEANSPCQHITQIQLLGATVPSQRQQRGLTEAYLNRCLDATDLNNLLKSITGWYFQRGYISSRAYLQPQDLTTGILVVQVVEGQVEGVDATGLPSGALNQVFPAVGGVLNLRDIEQGLDQINRLASRQSTMELIPGAQIGGSRIQVTTQRKRRFAASLSLDNLGQESTGEDQARISLGIDSPFRRLGLLTSSYSQELVHYSSKIFSRSASLHYDWPMGYWNVDLDASWFSYSSIVPAFASSFVSSGVSRSQSLRIAKVLRRGQRSKLGARYTLRRNDSVSYIEGSRVDTSSRTLVSGSLELWHQYFLNSGFLSNTVAWQKGLDWFDGVSNAPPETDSDAAEQPSGQVPQAEYSKLSLSTQLSLKLPPGWLFNRYQVQLSGQYARRPLFGPDQFSVGSAYSVRGFKGAGLASHKGAYLRQDLTRVISAPASSRAYTDLGISHVEVSIGLDGGLTRGLLGEDEKYHRLSSVSAKLAMYFGSKGSLSLEYAKPLSYPTYLPAFAGPPQGDDFYLRGSYAI